MPTRGASRQASAPDPSAYPASSKAVLEKRAAGSEARKISRKETRRPEDRNEQHRLTLQAIDDAVLAEDDLADVVAAEFRNDPA